MYWLIIFVSIATIGGRVATVQNHFAEGETPFFSANDRSRWCTIRSLVDEGTYEIDPVINQQSSIQWDSIDKVQHENAEGLSRSYSSKPTLLPTLLAGKYWVLQKVTGLNIEKETLLVCRFILFFCNVLPYFLFLCLLAAMLERIVVHDWTRYFVLCSAGFGTFLSTYAVTLNNHLPAAVCVMIAIYCLDRIYRTGPVCHDQACATWIHYSMVGLFAAFAAANELPALSFFAAAGLLCLIKSPAKTLLGFVPAALLIVAGFFGTNYLAHGTWRPAYTHRGDGELIATVDGAFNRQLNGSDDQKMNDGQVPDELLSPIQAHVEKTLDRKLNAPTCRQSFWKRDSDSELGRWVVGDSLENVQFAIEQTATREYSIFAWGNWYDYQGSYWSSGNRSGVDRGQKSQLVYAFHLLFGHHGIFSLTPIWLLSFAGLIALPFAQRLQLKWLGLMGVGLSLVVFAFYVNRPINDRNYGGYCSALRWMFWLIPIWLVAMVPVVDSLGKKPWGKFFCLALLALSIASALYSVGNPWCHPWLYEVWDSLGLPNK
ncbi:hypothetical protein OAG68_01605 [bacterium]|nr:hypothetical protein [bacterium]